MIGGTGRTLCPVSGPVETSLRLLSWFVVATVGTVMFTQAIGLDAGSALAVAQTLTPYATVALVPVLALAVAREWWRVGVVGALVGLGGILLAAPLVFTPDQPIPDEHAQPVRIAVLNLLYENDRTTEIADTLDRVDADVIVFTEYTPEHQRRLLAHPLAEAYEHRVEFVAERAAGTAVWSRFPTTEQPNAALLNDDVDVVIDGPSAAFRLWAVHPPTPFHEHWERDLRTIAERASSVDEPLVVAGDFNASYWHPVFRDILRSGLTSAHLADGRGWSVSWPTDGWVPAFVRIDHVLTNDGVVSGGTRDFDVPGSDHRGVIVTVTPAATARRAVPAE